MNNEIVIKTIDYRPCLVNDKKALFHKWIEYAYPVPPSLIMPNDRGGQKTDTLAIVEYENGTVEVVEPNCITFADNLIEEYAFKKGALNK